MISTETLTTLMQQVRIGDNNCWEWTGKKNALGYAVIYSDKKYRGVHRLMYEALTGEIPPRGMDICHSCHNRACVNPYHIRKDTHQANLMDSSRSKRLQGQGKTHCKRGHPLSGDNLSPFTPFRSCVICSRGRYRLRLGWPEHLAFDPNIIVPPGYGLDRETGAIVPSNPKARRATSNS